MNTSLLEVKHHIAANLMGVQPRARRALISPPAMPRNSVDRYSKVASLLLQLLSDEQGGEGRGTARRKEGRGERRGGERGGRGGEERQGGKERGEMREGGAGGKEREGRREEGRGRAGAREEGGWEGRGEESGLIRTYKEEDREQDKRKQDEIGG
eukprot:760140-Hanusia_phi.AAC.1